MRVVLEIVAGPLNGRRFQIVGNQSLDIGSTSRANVCIRGDALLAPQHFALETDMQVCRLRDLSGQGTTLLNNQAVELAIVRDGAEIRAGSSRFIVHVEGDSKELPEETVVLASTKPALAAQVKAGKATYRAMACDTGLTRYEGDARLCPPSALVAALGAEFPVYIMADNRRLGDEALAKLSAPRYLFDWLAEAAPHLSPLIIYPGECDDPAQLVQRGWRKDAVVCFFAKEPREDIADILRAAARVDPDKVMGICWPTILVYLFGHYHPDYIQRLMEPFACVLIEDPAKNDFWQIFSFAPLEAQLDALGLKSAVSLEQGTR